MTIMRIFSIAAILILSTALLPGGNEDEKELSPSVPRRWKKS